MHSCSGEILIQTDQLTALIASCDQRIAELMKPHEDAVRRLQTIPGVGRRSAEVLVSEIGVDMTRLSTSGHLASWARICPGTHESAGKHRGTSTGVGNNWLRTSCWNRRGPPHIREKRTLARTIGASRNGADPYAPRLRRSTARSMRTSRRRRSGRD
jgi:transposase